MAPDESKEVNAGQSFGVKFRKFLKASVIVYFFALPILLLLVRLVGERNWFFSGLLYFPPAIWLLPLAVLVPLSWFFHRRLCWLLLGTVAAVFFLYLDFHWGWKSKPETKAISILTNNIGSRKTRTLWPFWRKENPDIIALQEAWFHGRTLSRENPNHFVASRGEFVLVSKFEIKNSGFVQKTYTPTGYAAAWFEINFQGQSVIIYNVHFPTPRSDFARLRGRGFLAELPRRGGIYSAQNRTAYKKSMEERIRLAQVFLEQLRQEKRPFFVVGDFNAPSPGYVRRLFSSELTDAFAAKGRGYGLTFPGKTLNPLSLFGPWLRIDYVFASKEWRPLDCKVEPRQPAQHLAVFAQWELSGFKK